MRTLFIECNMGAAGDMLMAALLELHPDPDGFIAKMNGLGIPGVTISKEPAVKCGVTGTHVRVRVKGAEEESQDIPLVCGPAHSHEEGPAHDHAHDHAHEHAHEHHSAHDHGHDHAHHHHHDEPLPEHHHSGLREIRELLSALPVSERVKADALAVYGLIAEAESYVHGKPVEAVHFHEVGMMDAVADILGVCLLMEELAPQHIAASPVHVGSGQVRCAHGVLPVPAPATAYILKGIPAYGGEIRGELCTPTGAALLKHFVQEFGGMPVMATEAIGYGMGKKDFPAANCVRAFIGESKRRDADIIEIACNLDDMTGEALGFALEVLLDNGALDVYMVPLQMKKSRPGHMLACLCRPEDEERLAALMLKHTTTFGVRSSSWRRHTLARGVETVETEYGPVRVKTGSGFGVKKSKAEYEDLATLARENGLSFMQIKP